jgi:hypothetical protein
METLIPTGSVGIRARICRILYANFRELLF